MHDIASCLNTALIDVEATFYCPKTALRQRLIERYNKLYDDDDRDTSLRISDKVVAAWTGNMHGNHTAWLP